MAASAAHQRHVGGDSWQQRQCNGGSHGRGCRRHRRAATTRRRGSDEDTGDDSYGGDTDNYQQSTKIGNGNGNGKDDSNGDEG